MSDFKALCKRRLLEEMIRQSTRGKNYIVMLVDDRSLRILSACCNVYDVLEEGVTVIEPVSKRRQPLPELDALYFVSPDAGSIDAILRDFESEKNPQYSRIQIYFTSALPAGGSVLRKFAECPRILPRIRTFVEFNLDFVAQEQRIFHFDRPTDFVELFQEPRAERLDEIASQLFTVCATLGEKPAIRFQKSLRGVARSVAAALHEKIRSAEYKTTDSVNSTILILDRSIDLATLFVHEYTYQAVVYDLLNIATSVPLKPLATDQQEDEELVLKEDTFQYEIVSNLGKREKKRAVLGEQDELWVAFRHKHIQIVNQEVQEEIQKFIKENATAQIQKNEGQGATLQAIRALPQYQEMLAKYWSHVSLTEKCFDQLQERNLMQVGLLEQDLCCGVDKDGREVSASKLLASLSNHLSDPATRVDDKLRLLLLYFTHMRGVSPSDQTRLIEAAQLSLTSEQTLRKFLKLELLQQDFDDDAGQRLAHRMEGDRERVKYFKRRAKAAAYELSRFEPFIRVLMEKALAGDLHGGNYPFVEEARAPSRSQTSRKSSGTEQTIGRATEWDWSSTWKSSPRASTPPGQDRPRDRLIVFVIGGITHAEMRCAYEASRELGADVILGGTSILTPPHVLQLLKDAGSDKPGDRRS
ncbi:Sec1 family protein [Besnoitia besnoiti]|uniref:Sec1 family protein n=1 Tax=Besnoitia besnoiti TaxID=94643 RepID=A0A2A9MKZ5_BESBE|nr:Sec1 family protein [Besnoitia besnoiti]PFH36353.1 Sec1 family protein [Besnoitia besnoiti]